MRPGGRHASDMPYPRTPVYLIPAEPREDSMATYHTAWAHWASRCWRCPAAAYRPVTVKYRVDQSLTQEVEPDGGRSGKEVLQVQHHTFVTVTLNDSAGGRTMRVVIDSMKGDSATPIPARGHGQRPGRRVPRVPHRSGKPSPLTPTGTSPAASQVQGLLSDFFPWVRPGFKVGEAWADTSVNTTGAGSDTVTVRRVTNYQARPASEIRKPPRRSRSRPITPRRSPATSRRRRARRRSRGPATGPGPTS